MAKEEMLKMLNKLPNPYELITISLVIIIIANSFIEPFSYLKILSPLIAVITSLCLDFLITWIKTKKGNVKISAAITGLIVGSIVNYEMPIMAFLAALLAILLKHLIRYKDINVFNPAALGTFLLFLIEKKAETWWVVSGHPIVMSLIIILGILVSLRIMRFFVSLSYIITGIILIFALKGSINILYLPFFLPVFGPFYMATEPKTSPIKIIHQIAFGFLIAIIDGFTSYYGFIQSSFLLGLLLANFINAFFFRRYI